MDRPLTPERLAERWECTPNHIRAMCKKGELRHFRIGRGLYRIPPEAVAEYESRCLREGDRNTSSASSRAASSSHGGRGDSDDAFVLTPTPAVMRSEKPRRK